MKFYDFEILSSRTKSAGGQTSDEIQSKIWQEIFPLIKVHKKLQKCI